MRNMRFSDFDLHICAMLQDENQIQMRISAPNRQQHKIFLSVCIFLGGFGVESLLVEKQFFPLARINLLFYR